MGSVPSAGAKARVAGRDSGRESGGWPQDKAMVAYERFTPATAGEAILWQTLEAR